MLDGTPLLVSDTMKTFIIAIHILGVLYGANGKITGNIVNKETGEPLPGVNVVVEGIALGAATDVNGDYFIINIPPGDYTLQVSYIGYATQRVQNLRVNIDQTTFQNITMTAEVLEGEEVIVMADRPMVQKDLTSSQKITTGAEMKEMPVESFLGVLTLSLIHI